MRLERKVPGFSLLAGLLLLACPVTAANNEVLGEIQFVGASEIEESSGVWVDGQYVGFLKELKGSKKIMLLPGRHEISVRQAGWLSFEQSVVLQPGQKQWIHVAMERDPAARYPEVTAEVKLSVVPSRAAVFLNDQYIGHAGKFDGLGEGLLVAPGKHRFKITLPGYRTFETEVTLAAQQVFELKTKLMEGSILDAEELLREPRESRPDED